MSKWFSGLLFLLAIGTGLLAVLNVHDDPFVALLCAYASGSCVTAMAYGTIQ